MTLDQIDPEQLAGALASAIREKHDSVIRLLAAAAAADRTKFAVKEEDEEPDDLGTDGLYVVSDRTLTYDGYEVANWTRCAYGDYGDGVWADTWEIEEADEGDDVLPESIGLLLSLVGLEDCLPDVPEPPKPCHSQSSGGEYCVAWYSNGSDDDEIVERYESNEQAEEMCDLRNRTLIAKNPGPLLCCYVVCQPLDE